MEERKKGKCPHGEFYLDEGCPKCIAARQAAQEDTRLIVKVKYHSETTGKSSDREYTYFATERLGVGEILKVPVGEDRMTKAVVSAVDVPASEIAAYRDKVKTIPPGTGVHQIEFPAPLPDMKDDEAIQADANIKMAISAEQPEGVSCDPPEYEVVERPDEEWKVVEPLGPITDSRTEAEKTSEEGPRQVTPQGPPPALVVIETKITGRACPELAAIYQEAAALRRVAVDRVIGTADDLVPATNDLGIIANVKNALQDKRKTFLAPFKAKVDIINQAFADLMAPIETADTVTREKVAAFKAEQRHLAAEAERLALEAAAAAEAAGQAPPPAPAPPPVPARTRTEVATMGGRVTWKARVVDFARLSDEYKLPDMKTLNAKASSSKGTAIVPGVEFYSEESVTVRTK